MLWVFISLGIFLLVYWVFFYPRSQVFGSFPWHKETIDKVIALTFDDGPNEPFTSQLADFLNSENVKATFFSVGLAVKRNPEATRRLFKAGHTIGNHSCSHQFLQYFHHPNFAKQITETQNQIFQAIGKHPALFRPPWLFHTPMLLRTAQKLGLVSISGLFGSEFEVFQASAERMAARALQKAKPGRIIIFHDGYNGKSANRQQTIDAVKIIVPELKKRGFQFVTVDKLIGVNPYQN